jgi:hypothetical protein
MVDLKKIIRFKMGQRKELIYNLALLAFLFAAVYYVVQRKEDWEDHEKKSPLDCLYTSFGIQTGFGFTDGGAKSQKMRAIVILQSFMVYAQFLFV